ncbi:hypothetical protein FRB94_007374 [Tulasnella sp. JGI-2019a]|nr:hypothetical protein FRB93_007116 [Tulasnella sp. JGI-2019a]KAG8997904.1 hypothetical protein FRB94_007374 [Tulasnella sp. JGI-2019a]KAG9029108.1 hypothetical protein FRB95_005651 [Tulasnella sp. JGI-2019a]
MSTSLHSAPTTTKTHVFPLLRLSSPDLIHLPIPKKAINHGNCDLFKGHYRDGSTVVVVALKLPRFLGDASLQAETARRRFEREAKIWADLNHINILPFYGLIEFPCGAYLISPWVERGDLAKFLTARLEYFNLPPAGRDTIPAFHNFDESSIILGIASGLACLHTNGVIHGDLKGSNILLHDSPNDSLNPLICDFGLTKNDDDVTSDSMKGVATPRWKCPTLLDVADGSRTRKTDMFSFAMTIYEILSGHPPFPELSKFQVQFQYSLGKRPACEPLAWNGRDFAPLWELATACWDHNPAKRPDAGDVMESLAHTADQ